MYPDETVLVTMMMEDVQALQVGHVINILTTYQLFCLFPSFPLSFAVYSFVSPASVLPVSFSVTS